MTLRDLIEATSIDIDYLPVMPKEMDYEVIHNEDLDGEVEVDHQRKVIHIRCD